MVQEQRKAGVGAGRPASGPEDEGARAMRAAIDQQLRQTFAVASASVGQNLVFGSNGFEWVTPASVSFDDLAPSGGGSPGMLTTDGATWSYASYATARAALSLVVGTNVQAWSAKLDTVAALTWAANKGLMATSSSALATFDLTAAALTVLDDPSVAAMVDTLGGAASTGTGGLVRKDEPALYKPDLGVPSAGTLTNCTGLPTAGLVANAVTNAKLAQMATSTFKGRNSGGTGDPEDMTVAQVLAKLGCPYVVASEAGNPVRTIGVSSTAEQTLCSLTVPAGALGTAGKCVLELVGDITNNSGGSNNYQLKIKFGATTVYDKTSSFATGTQPRPLVIRVHLCALGATNLQRLTTELYHGYLLTATVGNGDWGDFNGRAFTMQGSAAEDSTAAKALAVTVQNSVSNANINWRLYSAKLVCYP